MKFDVSRALTEAAGFAFDRLPWTEGGRRAADRVGERFEEAGYAVERIEVAGDPAARSWRIAAAQICLGGGLSAALVLQGRGGSFVGRGGRLVACLVGGLVSLFLVEAVRHLRRRQIRTYNVMGHRPPSAGALVRVVYVTSLDVSPSVPRTSARRIALRLLRAGVLMMLALCLGPVQLPGRVRIVVLAAFAAICAAWLVCRVRPFPGESGDDNRDGLGLLMELARSWPRELDRRVETRFVAVGGQLLDGAGLERLASRVIRSWSDKPTLVVAVWSPGRASRLTIVSKVLADLARQTADDLWIPNRVEQDGTVVREICQHPAHDDMAMGVDLPFIGLIGVPSPGGPATIDPEAIRRAGQLAIELSLRWSRLHPPQPPGDAADFL